MTIRTTTPAPHAGETGAPAIPKDGKTPAMGAPPQPSHDEPDEDVGPQDDLALDESDTRHGPAATADERESARDNLAPAGHTHQGSRDLPPRDPLAAPSGLENLIAPTDPASMPRAEDDDITFEGSKEFHDRPEPPTRS